MKYDIYYDEVDNAKNENEEEDDEVEFITMNLFYQI